MYLRYCYFCESLGPHTVYEYAFCYNEKAVWKTKSYFARTGTWTLDPQIKSLMLYRLSYPGSCGMGDSILVLFISTGVKGSTEGG